MKNMYVIYTYRMTEWFLFFLVIFLYIHILQQYKYSDEKDVYEMDYIDNTNLQESCQLLQPIVFSTYADGILPKLPSLDDAVGEVGMEHITLGIMDETSTKYATPIPYSLAMNLLQNSSTKNYYSEHNETLLLQEAPEFLEKIQELDSFLQPPFTVQSNHDICIGAKGSYTPCRYHIYSRRFMVIQSGKITVKMAPWKKYAKYLHEIRDYELGEYRSNMNVWNPKEHHRREFDKIEFLEFDVDAGNILYIPSYWAYSIQYQEAATVVVEYTYRTLFNRLAFLWESVRIWMQRKNTYKTWFSTKEMSKPSDSPIIPDSMSVVVSSEKKEDIPDDSATTTEMPEPSPGNEVTAILQS
jgi:Cupin-like domain